MIPESVVFVGNLLVSAGAAAAAVFACVRPAALSGAQAPGPGQRVFLAMYAARAVPLGMLAAAAPLWGGAAGTAILTAAALSQLGDAAIGARRRSRGMCAGALAATAIHALAAITFAA